MTATFQLRARGPYSLAESAGFSFIDRETGPRAPELRIAFCSDTTFEPTALHLTQQTPNGGVEVHGDPAARGQLERILGLDVDATGFTEVGDRDPVVAALQAAAPGLRPPVLPSAYEAAAWCILAARRTGTQARTMRRRLAEQAGTVLNVAGEPVVCLPPPADLLTAAPVPGLDDVRLQRLRGVARAALDGRLDTAELRAMDPAQARAHVEELAGIGPFSSAIIVGRGLGHTDVLFGPITELNQRAGALYQLGHDASPQELANIAKAWSPWRSWVQVYFRAVTDRLPPRHRLLGEHTSQDERKPPTQPSALAGRVTRQTVVRPD
ncbi:DNA-3-methyladenine glycosylase [Actinoplanes sp. M2I2]|uniref:DNA-3-methyladenine glycosylase family protein n=1 Tax=Actinoplanes sp. M2I2 TaxID=1734444 RepID=UPI0020208265|nr:hypothetical protein [Actinoplanes sp. M2I2]